MYRLVRTKRTKALSGYVFLGRDILRCRNGYLVNVGEKTPKKVPSYVCFQIPPLPPLQFPERAHRIFITPNLRLTYQVHSSVSYPKLVFANSVLLN